MSMFSYATTNYIGDSSQDYLIQNDDKNINFSQSIIDFQKEMISSSILLTVMQIRFYRCDVLSGTKPKH